MMTETEHLLIVLAEECAEVAQNVSKALRFGLDDHEPGKTATNEQRIVEEIADVYAAVELLIEADAIHKLGDGLRTMHAMIAAKKAKVRKFMAYARERGALG